MDTPPVAWMYLARLEETEQKDEESDAFGHSKTNGLLMEPHAYGEMGSGL